MKADLPAWLDAGPADAKTTLVFLHGIGGGKMGFKSSVDYFASLGYRALAWDMPGYGDSPLTGTLSFASLAQSLELMLDAAQVQKAVLVGHSMGGMVAQEVMARRPELVNKLVLCGTSAAFGKPGGDWQQAFVQSRMAPLLAGQTMAELVETLVPAMAGPQALPEGLTLAKHCMAQVPVATYRRALEALVTFNRQDALSQIGVPTLLMAGECDPNAPPKVMQRMAERIPGSRYVEFPGIGHLMNLETPDDFDQALIEFLREAPPHRVH